MKKNTLRHEIGRLVSLSPRTFFSTVLLAVAPLCAEASELIEAEAFSESYGVQMQSNDADNQTIGEIQDGDWLLFENVELGKKAVQFKAKIRVGWDEIGNGGWIEIRKAQPDGPLLGKLLVVSVDIDEEWETRFTSIEPTSGVEDIYLVFKKDLPDADRLFELDWIQFSNQPVTMTGNPIIEHIRTADPSVHVWDHYDGDKYWIYASKDMPDDTDYSSMDGYHVFSSNDLDHWTDHGEVLHSRDVLWGHEEGGFMWAPDANFKDGKYYLYFPHKMKSDNIGWESPWRTGVAISEHPGGPFIPEPSYIKGTRGTDPACFIDDDGQAYLYFGTFQVARLKPNMIELDHSLPGVNEHSHLLVELINAPAVEDFMEGAWMHKHNGKYYYSWKQKNTKNEEGVRYDAHYAIGDSPVGPFKYGGPLNRPPERAQNHHSIVKIEGKWYFFYHVGGAGPHPAQRRMVCVAYLNHNPDGSIDLIEMSPQGVEILK
jgi:arabinoxylan arabinofuranohydrolase